MPQRSPRVACGFSMTALTVPSAPRAIPKFFCVSAAGASPRGACPCRHRQTRRGGQKEKSVVIGLTEIDVPPPTALRPALTSTDPDAVANSLSDLTARARAAPRGTELHEPRGDSRL